MIQQKLVTQRIKYTKRGDGYVTKYGKRYDLANFERLPYEHFYCGKKIHGVITICNSLALCIHITPDNEHAIVFYIEQQITNSTPPERR